MHFPSCDLSPLFQGLRVYIKTFVTDSVYMKRGYDLYTTAVCCRQGLITYSCVCLVEGHTPFLKGSLRVC